MGLVALKSFLGNDGRRYKPGDSCDEALQWKYPALRACLNFGMIEDTDGSVARHFGVKASKARDCADVRDDAMDNTTGGKPKTPGDDWICPDCAAAFKSKSGYYGHIKKAHRG